MAQQSNQFDECFHSSSQFDFVPRSLVYLITSSIDGSSFTDNEFSQEFLTIAQHYVAPLKSK